MIHNNIYDEPMQQYKENFSNLICEKTNDTDVLRGKSNMAFERAVSMSEINGSAEFVGVTKDRLREICSVKPGRKLIKALFESELVKAGKKIKFMEGAFQQRADTVCGEIQANYQYNAVDSERKVMSVNFKSSCMLAHEMIHLLHELSNCTSHETECMESMDYLEEQKTIIGFDHKNFILKNKLDYRDILCENAFNFSFGMPFRIDHQIGKDDNNWNCTINGAVECRKSLDQYFNWITDKLNEFLVPPGKEDDAEYMRKAIRNRFKNFDSASERLKNDSLFWVDLFQDHNLNKLTAIMSSMPKDLFKRKDFALALISRPLNLDVKKTLVNSIEKGLFQDEEILNSLILCVNHYTEKFKNIFAEIEIQDFITKDTIPEKDFLDLIELRPLFSVIDSVIPADFKERKEIQDSLSKARDAFKMNTKCSVFGTVLDL